jgi:transcription initiation factor TFIIIB Brf1 subunit/transcription initiation factor TFIIB
MVFNKEIVEEPRGGPVQAIDFTGQALGGYLGSSDPTSSEKRSAGISGSKSSYEYMKLMSDYTGREDSTFYSCARMIERVCEQLFLPKIVMAEAVVTAKRLLTNHGNGHGGTTAVSAFAIIYSCKRVNTAQVGVREILQAHRNLGRRVKMSDLIQLSLEVPVKARPRNPKDCISRLLARLSLETTESLQCKQDLVPVSGLGIRARLVLDSIDDLQAAGHNPWAIAATAIYASEVALSKEEKRKPRLSQKAVARAAGVAEYTIREQYRHIFRSVSAINS